MYCPEVSNAAIDEIQKTLSFELQRYSVEEQREFVEYTEYLINLDAYKSASKLGIRKVKSIFEDGSVFKSDAHKDAFFEEEVQNRITNERVISKWDANYWQDGYYLIKDHTGVFVPYVALPAQRIWRKMRADLNRQRLPIKFLDLKGRQQGDTTDKQGMVEHRLNFFPDSEAVIASRDKDSTYKMSMKFIESQNRQPFWLKAELEAFETGNSYKFDNGSFLDLGWGTAEYLGKGQTPLICHISEIASFASPESSLDNALFNAMHESEWLLQFLEGTAEARDDWFHKKVKSVIAQMAAGTTSWVFNFIAWFFRRDLKPTEAYVRARSVAFANWIPKVETLAMARLAEQSVKSWKYSREEMGSNWKMDREQMFWYELEYEQAELDGKLAEFLSQNPITVDQAFQHAGKTLYPIQVIQHHEAQAKSKEVEVYKLKGDPSEVSPFFWPSEDEILYGGKTISIICQWTGAVPASTFELIQIKFDGWDNFDPTNKFLIWEHPKRGFDYGEAVDTSDGLGIGISDEAVINITRAGTPEFRDRQVLEFASSELSQGAMWPFVLVPATYYSHLGPGNQILLTIECNKGYELQNAIIYRGYTNLFKRMDESSPYQDESKVQKYGFWTDRGTRPGLIGNFHTFFRGKHYDVFSPMLIEEARDLQKVKKQTNELGFSGEKIMGKKDNRIIAAAINLYAIHRREIAGHEKKTWEERNRFEQNIVDIKTFGPEDYEKDTGGEDVYQDFDQFDDDFEREEDFAFEG